MEVGWLMLERTFVPMWIWISKGFKRMTCIHDFILRTEEELYQVSEHHGASKAFQGKKNATCSVI
jgi:hypothetical protein